MQESCPGSLPHYFTTLFVPYARISLLHYPSFHTFIPSYLPHPIFYTFIPILYEHFTPAFLPHPSYHSFMLTWRKYSWFEIPFKLWYLTLTLLEVRNNLNLHWYQASSRSYHPPSQFQSSNSAGRSQYKPGAATASWQIFGPSINPALYWPLTESVYTAYCITQPLRAVIGVGTLFNYNKTYSYKSKKNDFKKFQLSNLIGQL